MSKLAKPPKEEVFFNSLGNPKKNLIRSQYVTNQAVWCADTTILGDTSLFIIYDLLSNTCVGFLLVRQPIEVAPDQIVSLIQLCLEQANDIKIKRPTVFHTDNHKVYNSKQYLTFLQQRNISQSYAIQETFGNQCIESFHTKLKSEILARFFYHLTIQEKAQITAVIPKKTKKHNWKQRASNKEIRQICYKIPKFQDLLPHLAPEAVTALNREKHKVYFKYTKDQVAFYGAVLTNQPEELVVAKAGTLKAQILQNDFNHNLDNVADAIKKAENLPLPQAVNFFNNLRIPYNNEPILAELQKLTQMTYAGFCLTLKQNNALLETNDELKQAIQNLEANVNEKGAIISIIHAELEKERKEKEALLDRRKKREQAETQPLRDPLTYEDFETLLEIVGPDNTYLQIRTRISLTILLITGIRVSELRAIQIQDLETLFNNERPYVKISRLKKKLKDKKAFLSMKARPIVKTRKQDFQLFKVFKPNPSDFFLTSQKSHDKPISREHLDREINKLLRILSEKTGKNLKSHSFRIGLLNQLWDDTKDIRFVQYAIGHTSVQTTEGYLTRYNDERACKVYEQLEQKKRIKKEDLVYINAKLADDPDFFKNLHEKELQEKAYAE